MKLLVSSIISIILMITFCIGITIIIRLSAHLIFWRGISFFSLRYKRRSNYGSNDGATP